MTPDDMKDVSDSSDRKLLGVGWDAGAAEVRLMYRRHVLVHHPDKCGGDPGMFVDIQQAYERVMARISTDDVPGTPSPPFHAYSIPVFTQQASIIPIIPLMCSLAVKLMAFWEALQHYKRTYASSVEHVTVTDVSDVTDTPDTPDAPPADRDCQQGQGQGQGQGQRKAPPPVVVDISVTLDDVYHARVKKLVLRVNSVRNNNGILLRKLLIPLLHHQARYTFPGLGDEPDGRTSGEGLTEPGDVEVNLNVTQHHSGVWIDDLVNRYDLHVSVKTTLYDFVFGREICIPGLPGGDVCVQYGGCEQAPLTHVVIANRGLPFTSQIDGTGCRGSLYVFFQLQMPTRPREGLAWIGMDDAVCRALLSALSGRVSEQGCVDDSGGSDKELVDRSWSDASMCGVLACSVV